MAEKSNEPSSSDKDMKQQAEYFIHNNVKNPQDYTSKYSALINEENSEDEINETDKPEKKTPFVLEETQVYKELRKYRRDMSTLENIQPYFIFNNETLKELVLAKPKTIDELKKIKGFGDKKCLKYGEDILGILSNFQNQSE